MNLRNNMRLFIAVGAVAVSCCGCLTEAPNYNARLRSEAIEAADITKADYYKGCLAEQLGLSTNQVRIEPGPGVTQVFVVGVTNDLHRGTVMAAAADVNAQNPFSPVLVSFQ